MPPWIKYVGIGILGFIIAKDPKLIIQVLNSIISVINGH